MGLVPLAAVMTFRNMTGPDLVLRFNLYFSAAIHGTTRQAPAPVRHGPHGNELQ